MNVKSPINAADIVRTVLEGVDREHFIVVCLDTINHLSAVNICHVGSLNSSVVHPRKVVKPAILSKYAAIIVAHNYTNTVIRGYRSNEKLVEAGKIISIDVLDYLIICNDGYFSLREWAYVIKHNN